MVGLKIDCFKVFLEISVSGSSRLLWAASPVEENKTEGLWTQAHKAQRRQGIAYWKWGHQKSLCPKICDILAFFLSIPRILESRIISSSQGISRVISGKFYQPNRKKWKTQEREFSQRMTMKPPPRHTYSFQITFLTSLNISKLQGSAFIW